MPKGFKPLIVHARFVMHFVTMCRDLAEAQRSMPDLTQEQFDALRSGRARLTGDTEKGINFELLDEE